MEPSKKRPQIVVTARMRQLGAAALRAADSLPDELAAQSVFEAMINDTDYCARIRTRRRKPLPATFHEWVTSLPVKDNIVGDFVEDAQADRNLARVTTYEGLSSYLKFKGACPEAIATGRRLWKRFEKLKNPS